VWLNLCYVIGLELGAKKWRKSWLKGVDGGVSRVYIPSSPAGAESSLTTGYGGRVNREERAGVRL